MRPTLSLCIVLALVGALPPTTAAQERSILRLLPTEGRELPLEGEVQGALSASDFLSPDNAYVEAWILRGETGRSVTIDLASDDFDAYLHVAGPGLTEALGDDDGGGGCNARITLTFLEAGEFHVVVSSTPSDVTGTFTLRTSSSPAAPLGYACGEMDPALLTSLEAAGQLAVGRAVGGRLEPGAVAILDERPVVAWEIDGVEGETVTVTMRSDDFDAYLFVYGPGMDRVETDDDSAGDLDAQLTLRFPASGRFIVGAGALVAGAGGDYTLEVERAVGPEDLAPIGSLDVPGSGQGALTTDDPLIEGRRTQAWTFEGVAGRSVTVELLSADFDAYLRLLGPGIPFPLEDDDSAGDLNARITTTLPEEGTFRILASALGAGQGAYRILVR